MMTMNHYLKEGSMNRSEGIGIMMKKIFVAAVILALLIAEIWITAETPLIKPKEPSKKAEPALTSICRTVEKGDSLCTIFSKHQLSPIDVAAIRNACLPIHPVRNLRIGRPYCIELDKDGNVFSFRYWINDESLLAVRRKEYGFQARMEPIRYTKQIIVLEGTIEENLVDSMCTDRTHLNLALALSDIYAWDIDFTTDLQKGDSYRLVVEGLYLNGSFKKFGKIMAAAFENKGMIFRAYLREKDGKVGYYDEEGNALQKMFLRAPLNFRRISSYFSARRFHPILKIRRPHLGLDYAAARGTPVSSVGEGVVQFAGWRGQYGNLVVIRHPNGWRTYYGHLSRIKRSVRRGSLVDQGQVIGYVGATGLATGPHLHYEVRHEGQNIDPLKLTASRSSAVPKAEIEAFYGFRDRMDRKLSSNNTIFATDSLSKDGKISG